MTASPVAVHPAIVRAIEQSATHFDLAEHATTDAERRAHLSTVRASNKAAMEMAKGNMPRLAGDGIYLCESRTNAGVVYRVDVYAQRCDCANQHACWHLAAANVCEEVAVREANDGDLLPQRPLGGASGARDLLADPRYSADDALVDIAFRSFEMGE